MEDAGGPLWTVHAAALFVTILVAAVTDLFQRRVDNRLVVAGALVGVALWTLRGVLGGAGAQGLWISMTGGAAGFALFFAFYWFGGIGAGDVKLTAAVGALTNWRFVLYAAICTAFAGAVLAFGWLLVRGGWREAAAGAFRSSRQERREAVAESAPQRTIPYAVAICTGTAWAIWEYYARTGQYPWG